jgi:hypothetical protein
VRLILGAQLWRHTRFGQAAEVYQLSVSKIELPVRSTIGFGKELVESSGIWKIDRDQLRLCSRTAGGRFA